MKLHLLCGIPGSGKSTLAQNLSGHLVSTDQIRKFLWHDETLVVHDVLVFKLVQSIIDYLLDQKIDVIIDATNLRRKKRKKYINLAKKYQADVIVHWLNCSLETALVRNAKRNRKVPEDIILALFCSLQVPNLNEGMDLLQIYDEQLKLVESIEQKKG